MANVSLVRNGIFESNNSVIGLRRLRARSHSFRKLPDFELVALMCHPTFCLCRSVGAL